VISKNLIPQYRKYRNPEIGLHRSSRVLQAHNIPDELKDRRQWVCSLVSSRKKPVQVNGRNASSTNPSTWNTFDACLDAAGRHENWGVAFIFTTDDPYTVIDLDHVRDSKTGVTEAWALAVIDELFSYTELSVSQTGWHVIARGKLAEGGNRRGRVEMYDHAKAITLTGNTVPFTGNDEIADRDLASLHHRMLVGQLDPMQKVQSTAGAGATRRPGRPVAGKSESERDFAKVGIVYTIIGRRKDPAAIEREFQRRFPGDYADRNRIKGPHAGRNYIRYTIERFLRSAR
jgi:hypothetical protein